jgi:hypothetical protein
MKQESLEEELDHVNPNRECDLVGISYKTANAPGRYELCQESENRVKTVVSGGVHPTIIPDEAL